MHPTLGALQYVRQTLTSMKEEINSNTIIVGDFNTPLIPMDRSSKQKISKETQTLNDSMDQLDLIDIYRTFHPKTMNFTFFSSAYFYLLQDRSQCSKIRCQLQGKKTIKNSNIWRLNNTLLNNQQITEEIKICIQTNENQNTTIQNLWDSVKAVLKGEGS